MGDLLAQRMTEVAAQATAAGIPVWFADPRDEFVGEAVCGNPETIHGIVSGKTPGEEPGFPPVSNQSFHPKISGTRHYADALESTLREIGI